MRKTQNYDTGPIDSTEVAERAVRRLREDMDSFYDAVKIRAGLTDLSYGHRGGFFDDAPKIDKKADCNEFLKKTGLAPRVFKRKQLKSMAHYVRLVGKILEDPGNDGSYGFIESSYRSILEQLSDSGLLDVLGGMEKGRIERKRYPYIRNGKEVPESIENEYGLLKGMYNWSENITKTEPIGDEDGDGNGYHDKVIGLDEHEETDPDTDGVLFVGEPEVHNTPKPKKTKRGFLSFFR